MSSKKSEKEVVCSFLNRSNYSRSNMIGEKHIWWCLAGPLTGVSGQDWRGGWYCASCQIRTWEYTTPYTLLTTHFTLRFTQYTLSTSHHILPTWHWLHSLHHSLQTTHSSHCILHLTLRKTHHTLDTTHYKYTLYTTLLHHILHTLHQLHYTQCTQSQLGFLTLETSFLFKILATAQSPQTRWH